MLSLTSSAASWMLSAVSSMGGTVASTSIKTGALTSSASGMLMTANSTSRGVLGLSAACSPDDLFDLWERTLNLLVARERRGC